MLNTKQNTRSEYARMLERKYAIVNRWKIPLSNTPLVTIECALKTLEEAGVLDFGDSPSTDFFVIRLRDKHAAAALSAYAGSTMRDDQEYALGVLNLAKIAAELPNPIQPRTKEVTGQSHTSRSNHESDQQ